MDFGRPVRWPAVILMVDGRVPLGGQTALERLYAEAEALLHELGGTTLRLHWDDEDPHRFRAMLEYETDQDFEAGDLRIRQEPAFVQLRERLDSITEGVPAITVWRESSRQYRADLVRAYWGLVDAREWTGLRAILADDVVMEWPAFNERIVGVENVIAANRAAPQNWLAQVNWVISSGDQVASSVEVVLGTGTRYVLGTLWTVRRRLIQHATEHWCPYGVATAPAWRRKFAEPISR